MRHHDMSELALTASDARDFPDYRQVVARVLLELNERVKSLELELAVLVEGTLSDPDAQSIRTLAQRVESLESRVRVLVREEIAALREENERQKAELHDLKSQLALTLVARRASSGTKAMPPRPPPPAPPRPGRAVAGTSLVCTACGCRWRKHPPDDVFPSGSIQLYDADQRPCVECCDNTSNPPLRPEQPDDSKGHRA